MLKGAATTLNMPARRDELYALCKTEINELSTALDSDAITYLQDAETVDINFPVTEYPEKVKSFNFDKTPEITGVLKGIKGQYLILEHGVLNIRKFGGYQITLET